MGAGVGLNSCHVPGEGLDIFSKYLYCAQLLLVGFILGLCAAYLWRLRQSFLSGAVDSVAAHRKAEFLHSLVFFSFILCEGHPLSLYTTLKACKYSVGGRRAFLVCVSVRVVLWPNVEIFICRYSCGWSQGILNFPFVCLPFWVSSIIPNLMLLSNSNTHGSWRKDYSSIKWGAN